MRNCPEGVEAAAGSHDGADPPNSSSHGASDSSMMVVKLLVVVVCRGADRKRCHCELEEKQRAHD